MRIEQSLTPKKSAKEERKRQVLFGLVEAYIESGSPIGSNTLKDSGFQDLSSATIRNYFADLEEEGYLAQLHTSGGRVPTEKAFREYAEELQSAPLLRKEDKERLDQLKKGEKVEITTFLQQASEALSELTGSAVFMMAPRFDNDFILDIKLVMLDVNRCLAVVMTNFGVIRTEVLHTEMKLSTFRVKRLEQYFHFRLTELEKPENLEPEEEALGKKWYNEVVVRYLVGYSHFSEEDIYRTGMSRLVGHPGFEEVLSLFEKPQKMRHLLRECHSHGRMKIWVGEGLHQSSVLAIPYAIHGKPIGALAVLTPLRTRYRELFGVLHHFSAVISEVLTQTVYKYKITYRQPMEGMKFLPTQEKLLYQLEDQTNG